MGLVLFAVTLCILNIALWFFFFKQFKRTFSPDTILKNIRVEVDKLLIEISRETDADLTLLEERRRGLMQLLEKADKRILLAEDELKKRETEKMVLSNLSTSSESVTTEPKSIETIQPQYPQADLHKTAVNKTEATPQLSESKQTDLFDIQVSISEDARLAQQTVQRTTEAPAETVENTAPQEALPIFIKPPLVKPPPKLSFKEQVNELHHAGMSIETIASRLGRTKTEIEIALAVSE